MNEFTQRSLVHIKGVTPVQQTEVIWNCFLTGMESDHRLVRMKPTAQHNAPVTAAIPAARIFTAHPAGSDFLSVSGGLKPEAGRTGLSPMAIAGSGKRTHRLINLRRVETVVHMLSSERSVPADNRQLHGGQGSGDGGSDKGSGNKFSGIRPPGGGGPPTDGTPSFAAAEPPDENTRLKLKEREVYSGDPPPVNRVQQKLLYSELRRWLDNETYRDRHPGANEEAERKAAYSLLPRNFWVLIDRIREEAKQMESDMYVRGLPEDEHIPRIELIINQRLETVFSNAYDHMLKMAEHYFQVPPPELQGIVWDEFRLHRDTVDFTQREISLIDEAGAALNRIAGCIDDKNLLERFSRFPSMQSGILTSADLADRPQAVYEIFSAVQVLEISRENEMIDPREEPAQDFYTVEALPFNLWRPEVSDIVSSY